MLLGQKKTLDPADAALQAAFILGEHVPPVQPPAQEPTTTDVRDPALAYRPLDREWHDQHGQKVEEKKKKEPKQQTPVKAPPEPKRMVITHVDVASNAVEDVMVDQLSEETRSHTLASKVGSTFLLIFFGIVISFAWVTAARYSIAGLLSLDWLFRYIGIDLQALNRPGLFRPFSVINESVGNLRSVWIFPLVVTMTEATWWPRRRTYWRDLIFFWRRLAGESRLKHGIFLGILVFDVLTTCVGALSSFIAPNEAFTWAVLQSASRGMILTGLLFGFALAVSIERVLRFLILELIGMWIPADWRIHTWLRPAAYIRYE